MYFDFSAGTGDIQGWSWTDIINKVHYTNRACVIHVLLSPECVLFYIVYTSHVLCECHTKTRVEPFFGMP